MKSPESEEINEAEKLLTLLMEEIDKVQSFKGKWTLLSAKLANLPTHLNSLSGSPRFSTSSLAADLLRSVVKTLYQTLALAEKCSNPNPPAGKLRTQSDLDSVSAQLDQHADDVGILLRSLDCPGDSPNSTRGLLTRLQIGSSESRNSAMDSVLSFLHEDDKNVTLAVDEGFVGVLVNLLDSSSVEIRDKAVSAIARVSTLDGCKKSLFSQCPVLTSQLLRILDSRNEFWREKASIALQALSFTEENARVIGCPTGIASLVEVCRSGMPYSQAYAAGVLRNVSGFAETRRFFVEESNAIESLIAVASSGSLVAQGNSIGCLNNLILEDESLKLLLAKGGTIQCLKSYWDAAPSVQSLKVAIELLKTLASCKSIAETLISEGFLSRLREVLSCENASVRLVAAETICELGFSSKTRKEIGNVGIVPRLIGMLDAKLDKEKEMAAKALSILMVCAGNRKVFVKEEKSIESVVRLLDPSGNNVDKKHLVSILVSIVHSSRYRKQIVDFGGLDHLQRLIDMGVDGAKKLHESLHRNNNNNILGVFSISRK